MTINAEDARLVHLDQQLCFKLYAASRMIIRAYKPLLDAMGVTYPKYLVLMVLWQEGVKLTVGQIGEKLLLDSGTLTPLIKRMEALNLVSRTRGPKDERQVWVEITSEGQLLQITAVNWRKQTATGISGLDVIGLGKQLEVLLSEIG